MENRSAIEGCWELHVEELLYRSMADAAVYDSRVLL